MTEMKNVCPIHQIPDCSPLLNGCSELTKHNAANGDESVPDRAITHELKCDHHVFEDVISGLKTFDIRKEDDEHRFEVGNLIRLREHARGAEEGVYYGAAVDPGYRGYSGRYADVEVTYVMRSVFGFSYGLVPNAVCMSITLLDADYS